MAKIDIQQWDADFLCRTPMFNDLATFLGGKQWLSWPSCQALNALLPTTANNDNHQPIEFVPQRDKMSELHYEQWIYQRALCPHRVASWHDFFNAMIWCLFPRVKREMNAQHCDDIAKQGRQSRTRRRDAITMFDECGVVVPYSDPELAAALKGHQWQRAFVTSRQAWGVAIDAFIIGHANYEKALAPYIGFTGKALYLQVEPAFFALAKREQYHDLDGRLAGLLKDDNLLSNNSVLFPLPMLGVPGWYDDNRDADFYRNTHYFRPARCQTNPG